MADKLLYLIFTNSWVQLKWLKVSVAHFIQLDHFTLPSPTYVHCTIQFTAMLYNLGIQYDHTYSKITQYVYVIKLSLLFVTIYWGEK